MKFTTVAASLACALIAPAAQADVALDQSNIPQAGLVEISGSGTVLNLGDLVSLGQTFTAGLSGRLVRVDLAIFNQKFFPSVPGEVTIALQDAGGAELFSTTLDNLAPPDFWFGVTWEQIPQFNLGPGVQVVAGAQYRILATGPGGQDMAPFWAEQVGSQLTPYAGGAAFGITPSDYTEFRYDRGFRTYVDTGVPEPETWALIILGFGGAGAALRRRRVAA